MSRARAIRDLANAALAPGYAMGGSVDADEINPNFAGDEGITAMDRSMGEVAAPPLMLSSGGQARSRDFFGTLEQQESGGNPNARNPRSTATGPFQFIEETWNSFAQANPQLFQGMNPRQILAARTNPEMARRGAEWYRNENERTLTRAGLEPTPGNLALSHFLGSTGARRVLQGDPAATVVSTVPNGARVLAANPHLRGVPNAQLIAEYGRRYNEQPAESDEGGRGPRALAAIPPPPGMMAAPSELPLPLPPPPTPPAPPMRAPAAAPRRPDTGALRRAMSSMDYQQTGESPTAALENHMRMVQSAQRRFATPTATMAEGGLARASAGLADTLGSMGRGDDSLVAHITPREALMLKAMGGSGTINPYTGLLEFDDGGDGGDGGGGGSAGESGPGAGDGPSGAGGGGGSAGEGAGGASGGPGDGGGGGSAGESGPGAGEGASGAGGGGGGEGEGGPSGGESAGEGAGTGGGASAGDAGGDAGGGEYAGPALVGLVPAASQAVVAPSAGTTTQINPLPMPYSTRAFSGDLNDALTYGQRPEVQFYQAAFAEGGQVSDRSIRDLFYGMSSIPDPEQAPQGGLARAGFADGGSVSSERPRRTAQDEIRAIRAQLAGEMPASPGLSIVRGFGEGGGGFGGIIRPATARAIEMRTRLPQDPRFLQAVEATPGARITDDGLELELIRYQKPEQAGAQAIREGVFYLPATLPSRSVGTYRGPSTAGYGGPEMVRGDTLLRAPMPVSGNTGGGVPERAFRELTDDATLRELIAETRRTANAPLLGDDYVRNVEDFLDAWGGNPDIARALVDASRQGNRMRYALQENVIGNRARAEGYDSIVGTGARRPRISEVFDLREAAYPVPGRPEFEMLLPQFEGPMR